MLGSVILTISSKGFLRRSMVDSSSLLFQYVAQDISAMNSWAVRTCSIQDMSWCPLPWSLCSFVGSDPRFWVMSGSTSKSSSSCCHGLTYSSSSSISGSRSGGTGVSESSGRLMGVGPLLSSYIYIYFMFDNIIFIHWRVLYLTNFTYNKTVWVSLSVHLFFFNPIHSIVIAFTRTVLLFV